MRVVEDSDSIIYTAGEGVSIEGAVISIDTTQVALADHNHDKLYAKLSDISGLAPVSINPSLSTGTKIAEYSIGNTSGILYAPAESESGSVVTISPSVSSGTKIADYSIDGVAGELYAPTGSEGGSVVTITPSVSSGTKIADYSIDGVAGSLYAPSGDGSSASYTFSAPLDLNSNTNTVSLKVDATTIDVNGSDQLYVKSVPYTSITDPPTIPTNTWRPILISETGVSGSTDVLSDTLQFESSGNITLSSTTSNGIRTLTIGSSNDSGGSGLVVSGDPILGDIVQYDGSQAIWKQGILTDYQTANSTTDSSLTVSLGSFSAGYMVGTLYLMDYGDGSMQIVDIAVSNIGSYTVTQQVRVSSPNILSGKFTITAGNGFISVECVRDMSNSSITNISFVAQLIYLW